MSPSDWSQPTAGRGNRSNCQREGLNKVAVQNQIRQERDRKDVESGNHVDTTTSSSRHHSLVSPEACTLIEKISDNGGKPIIVTVPLPENVVLDATSNRDSEGTHQAGVENVDSKWLFTSEHLVSAITESNTKRVTRRSRAARRRRNKSVGRKKTIYFLPKFLKYRPARPSEPHRCRTTSILYLASSKAPSCS